MRPYGGKTLSHGKKYSTIDTLNAAPLATLNRSHTGRNLQDADGVREKLTNYFLNQGKLMEWQDRMI
ncbi:unnamed protein product [Acanthoscelides obtectus]|uniref:Uncharacterized protein n=1 Tax=Acanthoscelides obtectus TaxID=200917 RepID=A0A9P0K4A6_ACAOB|nr:unnamed protein product [Acanthoscelides obtectus]CAK1623467.1 hypothetical protein AOBTE_LOCUS2019 [Acanthoscelides obtectus]